MRRAIAVGALFGGIFACERVCGELEPLPASATGGVDAGSALPDAEGMGGMGGLGQTTGGSTADPSGAGGMGGGGIAGSTTQPPGGSGGASGCRMYPPDNNGVLMLMVDSEGNPTSAFGVMRSDLGDPEPQPIDAGQPPGEYNEVGEVSDPDVGFSFVFGSCIDAQNYFSVRFNHRTAITPNNMSFAVVDSGMRQTSEAFIPGVLSPKCLSLQALGRRNITEFRWTYSHQSDYTVNVTIYDVAFHSADCPTGGTGGSAGSAGRGGVGGS